MSAARPRFVAALSPGTLALGLAATVIVVVLLFATARERDRLEFAAQARDAQDAITARVETSIALLRATAGLYTGHGEQVTVASFRRYAGRLALRERYPGLLGIGFTRRLAPQERETLERQMVAQGHDGFRVWPAGERDELHAIVHLEPLDERNRAAIGYDMYTQQTRRAAMARARDDAEASASGIVELVQEIDARKQPGFLIYVPVYRDGAVPPTVEERRERLVGFAYSPIRAVDFLSSAFRSPPAVALSVYHGTAAQPRSLLYAHGGGAGEVRFSSSSTITVAGEPWTFVFQSRASAGQALAAPLMVALSGTALSLLLAFLVARERRARADAQHALERERVARSEAERASTMKDEFLATLSHELRTPLNAIVGWTQLLRNGTLEPREAARAVEIVERNARAQARLIEDLLDMNRIVAGKLRLEVQAVDLAGVVADAVASLVPAAEAKGLRLHTIADSAPLIVRGDPSRLQQIVWNLVSNAVKFTPRGGRIQVALERAGSQARISVADNGQGIAPEMLERVFDRFSQSDASTTRRHGGLGLGLAIARQLAELHGGAVRAASGGANAGATFVVELPLMIVHPEGSGREARPARPQGLAGVKVLVVEDEADARALIARVLHDAGAQVHLASGAEDGLAAVRAHRPDVLLSDIGMAGMDGYEMIRRVRALGEADGGRVPAAAITAYVRAEDRLEALRAGFQMQLAKPVRPDELVAAVAALAGRGGDQDAGPLAARGAKMTSEGQQRPVS